MTEPIDPRHQVIINTVAKLTEIGHKKEAETLKDKAAKLETFDQLDELHRYCLSMLDFIG